MLATKSMFTGSAQLGAAASPCFFWFMLQMGNISLALGLKAKSPTIDGEAVVIGEDGLTRLRHA
jgi:hypothetical protein